MQGHHGPIVYNEFEQNARNKGYNAKRVNAY